MFKIGSSSRIRTCDSLINSQVLYRLSYRGMCMSCICFANTGPFTSNYLLSQIVSNQVSSAFMCLTTVFGMGTGETT